MDSTALNIPAQIDSATTPIDSKTATDSKTAPADTPIRFLSGIEEKYMVWIPIFGIVATVALWALGYLDIGFEVTESRDLITSLIFLDSVHLVWSFVLMLSIPELKQWAVAEKAKETKGWAKGLNFWGKTLVIAVVLGIIIYILKVSPTTSVLRGMATTWLFLEMLGPTHHTIAQMRGISFCYNSAIRRGSEFSEADKKIAMTCERNEKFLFNALLWGEILFWLPGIFELDKFDIPGMGAIESIGAVLAISSAAGILTNALYYPNQARSNKFAFLLRVVLFPLKMLSAIGGIFVRAAHGTEYVVIFNKMVRKSVLPKNKRIWVYLAAVVLSLLWLGPFFMTWTGAMEESFGIKISDLVLGWAVFVTFIIRFSHYYMDSVMFKMSDPATREAVAPLLAAD